MTNLWPKTPGGFLLHYSNPKQWRLRNEDRHPVDPGWEDGAYSHCHPDIRPLVSVGTWILDVVPRFNKAVIRSAFRIKTTDPDSVLRFNEFYFADGEPIILPGPFIQYRKQTMSAPDLDRRLDQLRSTYTLYKAGERPRSISFDDWKEMVGIRRDTLD